MKDEISTRLLRHSPSAILLSSFIFHLSSFFSFSADYVQPQTLSSHSLYRNASTIDYSTNVYFTQGASFLITNLALYSSAYSTNPTRQGLSGITVEVAFSSSSDITGSWTSASSYDTSPAIPTSLSISGQTGAYEGLNGTYAADELYEGNMFYINPVSYACIFRDMINFATPTWCVAMGLYDVTYATNATIAGDYVGTAYYTNCNPTVVNDQAASSVAATLPTLPSADPVYWQCRIIDAATNSYYYGKQKLYTRPHL